jgi:hypothetical protein
MKILFAYRVQAMGISVVRVKLYRLLQQYGEVDLLVSGTEAEVGPYRNP